MRQSAFWLHGDLSMHSADGTEDSIAKWGAAGSTVGTGAGVVTALGIHASGVWCKPQKNPAPGRDRPQTSGRVLQRDFSM